jgi:hypothetical protein
MPHPIAFPRLTLLACSAALALLAGCGDDAAPAARPDAGPPATAAVTYWRDVAPVVNAKCARCHQAGGIAPFALDSYEQAKRWAAPAADVTARGIMPPYLVTHDGSCGDFEASEALTAAERAVFAAWAASDKVEGTPVMLPRPPVQGLAGPLVEMKTPLLAPRAQGGKLAEFDEYRCFAVDAAAMPGMPARGGYITDYEVIPGNAALVHHVIAFLVDPTRKARDGRTNAEVMQALDATDPDRTGWPCFGMAGEGLEPDSAPAVWAPGQGPVSFPRGMGVQVRPTDKIIVQMHYNLSDPRLAGQTDSTALRLRVADAVERRLVFVVEDGLLDTLFSQMPVELAPGSRSVKFEWKTTGRELGIERAGVGAEVELVAVMPHMHERGVRKEMRMGRAGSPLACSARVERWNFHWQKLYFYSGTRPRIGADTELALTCEYDTSRDRMPVLPGWGTRNEMCTAILMLALPPGA